MGEPRKLEVRNARKANNAKKPGKVATLVTAAPLVATIACADEGGAVFSANGDGGVNGNGQGSDAVSMDGTDTHLDSGRDVVPTEDAGPTPVNCSNEARRRYLVSTNDSEAETTSVVGDGDSIRLGGRNWTVGYNEDRESVTLTHINGSTTTVVYVDQDLVETTETGQPTDTCVGIERCTGFSVSVESRIMERTTIPVNGVVAVRGQDGEVRTQMLNEGSETAQSPDNSTSTRLVTGNDDTVFAKVNTSGSTPLVDRHDVMNETSRTTIDLGNGRSVTLLGASEQVQEGCHNSGLVFKVGTPAQTPEEIAISATPEIPTGKGATLEVGNVDLTVLDVSHEPSTNENAAQRQFGEVEVSTPAGDTTLLVSASNAWANSYGIGNYVDVDTDTGTVRVVVLRTYVGQDTSGPTPEPAPDAGGIQ